MWNWKIHLFKQTENLEPGEVQKHSLVSSGMHNTARSSSFRYIGSQAPQTLMTTDYCHDILSGTSMTPFRHRHDIVPAPSCLHDDHYTSCSPLPLHNTLHAYSTDYQTLLLHSVDYTYRSMTQLRATKDPSLNFLTVL